MTITASDAPIPLSTDWASIPELVGKVFRSSYLQVDSDHQALFEKAAYLDRNEHEMGAEFYDDGLVEGTHLLGIVDHLVNGVLVVIDDAWAGWNYGYDKVRFISEVSTRDRVRVYGAVTAVAPRGENFLVTLTCTLEVEGRSKPGAVIEWKVLWLLS